MQVVILSLANNRLTGTVPYMPNLLMLDMSSNRLTEPRFDAVPAFLQLLYLSNNSLTGELSQLGSLTWSPQYMEFISSYPELSLLDLSYNNLSGSLPQVMPFLSVLDISNNSFAGTLPSSWSWRMPSMARLRLDKQSGHRHITTVLVCMGRRDIQLLTVVNHKYPHAWPRACTMGPAVLSLSRAQDW